MQLAYASLPPYLLFVHSFSSSPRKNGSPLDCDRVKVRWQAKAFNAAVIHVHAAGKVDVEYDIDGSVGIFLTAKEHGLKLLGDEEKKGGGRGRGRRA